MKEAGQEEGIPIKELAERTGMAVKEIEKVNARLARRPVSLDARLHTETSDNQQDMQIKEDVDTEGTAFANEMIEIFIATVKDLPVEQQVVLALHYYSRLDFRSIAEELVLPELRISQLHSSGIAAVKAALTNAASERG